MNALLDLGYFYSISLLSKEHFEFVIGFLFSYEGFLMIDG